MAKKRLYVGNLSYSTNEDGLLAAFAEFGGENAAIVQGRGFGFVDVDEDKMQSAVDKMHGATLDGRSLIVNEARPREARPPRSGGGGYGGGGGGGYGGGGGGYSGGGGGRGGGRDGGRQGGKPRRW